MDNAKPVLSQMSAKHTSTAVAAEFSAAFLCPDSIPGLFQTERENYFFKRNIIRHQSFLLFVRNHGPPITNAVQSSDLPLRLTGSGNNIIRHPKA